MGIKIVDGRDYLNHDSLKCSRCGESLGLYYGRGGSTALQIEDTTVCGDCLLSALFGPPKDCNAEDTECNNWPATYLKCKDCEDYKEC